MGCKGGLGTGTLRCCSSPAGAVLGPQLPLPAVLFPRLGSVGAAFLTGPEDTRLETYAHLSQASPMAAAAEEAV